MKDNKCRIFLMYIFRLTMEINLPKFAFLIPQIFLKFYQFLVFSTFFFCQNVGRLGCYGFFKELNSIAVISVKKVRWTK